MNHLSRITWNNLFLCLILDFGIHHVIYYFVNDNLLLTLGETYFKYEAKNFMLMVSIKQCTCMDVIIMLIIIISVRPDPIIGIGGGVHGFSPNRQNVLTPTTRTIRPSRVKTARVKIKKIHNTTRVRTKNYRQKISETHDRLVWLCK
jgi:hypothetical protein